MKNLIALLLLISLPAFAAKVDIKDVDGDDEGSTTIEITKNKKKTEEAAKAADPLINEGTATVEGDPAPLLKEAKANWKAACAEWKKELKADNVGNTILVKDCGNPGDCPTVSGARVCTSEAKYKIRVKN